MTYKRTTFIGAVPEAELDPATLGAKGAWLHWLARRDVARVPEGFVVPVGLLEAVAAGDAGAREEVEGALASLASHTEQAPTHWAVRASPVRSNPGILPSWLDPSDAASVVERLCALRVQSADARLTTAAVVQRRVHAGPAGWVAAAFSRDPTRGTAGIVGEWSPASEGERVVGGRDSLPALAQGNDSLRARRPEQFAQVEALLTAIEQAAGRVMELELLHDGERLWALQARPVARRAAAAVRLATERAAADPEAWLDLKVADAEDLWVERIAASEPALARGLAASPGVACGLPVWDPKVALQRSERGEDVVLLRPYAIPEDVPVIRAARGVVTSTGGLTCHAAVMARGLSRPAVVGCADLHVSAQQVRVGDRVLDEHEPLTIDGYDGSLYLGRPARVRVPGGAPIERLLELLRARRGTALWVRDLPEALIGEARRINSDGLLLDRPPTEGSSGLPTFIRVNGSMARRTDTNEELPLLSCVDEEQWNDLPHVVGMILEADGEPPPNALQIGPVAAWAVPAEFFLAWALALDPVQHTHQLGPDCP